MTTKIETGVEEEEEYSSQHQAANQNGETWEIWEQDKVHWANKGDNEENYYDVEIRTKKKKNQQSTEKIWEASLTCKQ